MKFFTDTECKTEATALAKTTVWGSCMKIVAGDTTMYLKLTGAQALQAAAAAVLAMAASQF